MARAILLTGASGALGPHLLYELLRSGDVERVFVLLRRSGHPLEHRVNQLRQAVRILAGAEGDCFASWDRIVPVAVDIRETDLAIGGDASTDTLRTVDTIIHAAANTNFTAPTTDLFDVNVAGTRNLLAFARRCPRLQQFMFVSTACVAGTRTGVISECLDDAPPAFVNEYERTKWQAEQLVATADVPARIARLSTCLGDHQTGYVHRFGAIHHCLRWLMLGLVPMMPGAPTSPVDVIASDVASRWIARVLNRDCQALEVCHLAAGERALSVADLLEYAVEHLQETLPAWNRRQIEPPMIVDRDTFERFHRSAIQTGDMLFARVLSSASSFLPALLYPKTYETTRAEAIWGGPLPLSDCRSTLAHVIDFGNAHDWKSDERRSRHDS
jgi:nucleoside-diphosphate-sugar epimerase